MIYLSNEDNARILNIDNCVAALSEAFEMLAAGRAVSRPRTDIWVPCDRPDGYYRWGSMEGAIAPLGLFVTRMKSDIMTWTAQGTDELHSVEPGTFSGFIMVFSTRNGAPLAIMNDGILHHLRVGAGAALGAKALARADASVVGIIGSGEMARVYLPGFCAVRDIKRAKVFSPNREHRESYAAEMARLLGIPVEPLDNAEQVVRGSHIVATCTDSNRPVITDKSWIEPGMHLANNSSREWSWEIVQSCDRVVQIGTETLGSGGVKEESERRYGWPAWVIGSAEEVARMPKRGVSNMDFLKYPTLSEALLDPSKRRTAPEQVTFFHNLGLLGFQFAAIAGKALQLATERGLGTPMSTAPFLQNIRN